MPEMSRELLSHGVIVGGVIVSVRYCRQEVLTAGGIVGAGIVGYILSPDILTCRNCRPSECKYRKLPFMIFFQKLKLKLINVIKHQLSLIIFFE